MSMADRIAVEVDAVSYTFQNGNSARPVLDAVTVNLVFSKTLAITGPSGCGKTTLLRLVSGLLEPSDGHVRFCEPQRKPRVGFMFQDYKLVPWLNVRKNLVFGHDSNIETGEQFQEVVEVLRLGDHLAEFPSRLSGGLKERTALGRALLGNPELLLLDEPLSSTDYLHRLAIEDYVFDRVRRDSISAIIVTHDLDQAVANADQVLILPQVGSSHRASILNVPNDLRLFNPSQARLAPRMVPVMRGLISDYEDMQ